MISISRNGPRLVKLGFLISDYKISLVHTKLSRNVGYLKNHPSLITRYFVAKYSTFTTDKAPEEIKFDSITNGNKEVEHKLKVILLEADVMRQEGRPVPDSSFFTEDHWRELLNLPTRTARKKFLEYLFKLSRKKENRETKKFEKKLSKVENNISKEEKEKSEQSFEDFALTYDLSHNNIFLRFYDTTINQMYNNRLIQAMMFGQKLVIDCGYEEHMAKRENMNCAKQLMLLFGENRVHEDPFDLHFCNANLEGPLLRQLHKNIPSLYEPSFPINIHQCSYLDLFPRDQLVYLTPHCRQEITEFDHDAIYIMGAIVDKINQEPLSLAKAKKEGLRMAKLPLDKYLQWGAGSGKSLALNQVVSILNDVKFRGDWQFALRHVPKRKLRDDTTDYNIKKSIVDQKFGRAKTEKRWIPASNINFDKLSFKRNKIMKK